MAEFEGLIRGFMEAKRRGIPAEEVVLVSTDREKKAMSDLREAFEKWAREVGFENFEVKDEEADDLELEYVDDDVEVAWCAFAEGERVGWFKWA